MIKLANFTPEEINEILAEFFNVAGKRQYIGARYVPVFGRRNEDSIAWDNSAPYEPLTIVLYQGNSYTSRTYVPAGVAINNQTYWALTGNYNAQVELYRQETAAVKTQIDETDALIPKSSFDSTNTVKKYVDDLGDIIPSDNFDSTNTVKKYVDDIVKTRVIIFDTVSAMKSAQLFDGMVCLTKGYNAIDDNGSALYHITSTGTADEMNVIACGALYANYMYSGTCSPQTFGAYGDGIHNDTAAVTNALNFDNVFFEGTYLVNKIQFQVLKDTCIDLCGATFKPIDIIDYVFSFEFESDNTSLILRNGNIACLRKACEGIHVYGNTGYKCNVTIENIEVSNTDNFSNAYNSNGIAIYVGTNAVTIHGCNIHDLYRTFDNESIHGTAGIVVTSINGFCEIYNNIVENMYQSDSGNINDVDSIKCFSNNDNASCEIYGNRVINSQRRFIKLQMENAYVHDNVFLQNVANNLSYPFDFQKGVGRFEHNYVKIDTHRNVDAERGLIKMTPRHGTKMSICDNTIIADSSITGDFLNALAYIPSYSTQDLSNLDINISRNNFTHVRSMILYFNLDAVIDNVNIKILDNYSSEGYRIFYIGTSVPDTFAYKIHAFVDGNSTDFMGIDTIDIIYQSNSILQDAWFGYNNDKYSRRNRITSLDCSKIRKCAYHTSAGSSIQLTNLPQDWTSADFSYKDIEGKRIENNLNLFESINAAAGATPTTKSGVVSV